MNNSSWSHALQRMRKYDLSCFVTCCLATRYLLNFGVCSIQQVCRSRTKPRERHSEFRNALFFLMRNFLHFNFL